MKKENILLNDQNKNLNNKEDQIMKEERINELVNEVKELEENYKYFNMTLLYQNSLGEIFHNYEDIVSGEALDVYDTILEVANDNFIYYSDADEFLKNYNIYEYIKEMNADYGIIPKDQCQLANYIWEREVIENDIDTMKKVISIIDEIIELEREIDMPIINEIIELER